MAEPTPPLEDMQILVMLMNRRHASARKQIGSLISRLESKGEPVSCAQMVEALQLILQLTDSELKYG